MLKEDTLCIITNLFDSNSVLSAKVAALEAEVEKFTSTNNARDEILLCGIRDGECSSAVVHCNRKFKECNLIRKTSPVA